MKKETFTAQDGKEISLAVWDNVSNPKAVVQLSHGMAEHIERYDDFARFLNSNRYIVFGDDHRSHGLTDKESLGLRGTTADIFKSTVSDMAELTDWAKKRWEMPVVLFGHSYGSFLSQEYLTMCSDKIAGCVLSGSSVYGGLLCSFGRFVSRGQGKKDKPGKFFANMTFESYDKKTGEGKNGWLSRDAQSNQLYSDDERCGFVCSNGFYYDFFGGMKKLSKDDFGSVRRDLPLLIIYGDEDYVGGRGKLVVKLTTKYQNAGLSPKVIAYKGARHEILNETNKDEVYNDVLMFLASFL